MREGFAFDKENFYGFDYDNSNVGVQAEIVPVVEDMATSENESEMSAKEAFDEFARGPVERLPWPPVQTMPGHIPRHERHHAPPRPTPQPHRPQPPRHPNEPHRFDHYSGSAPRFAPPAYVPQQAPGLRAVDPGAISRCLYSNTYVWLNNGQGFWFFPTFIGRRSIAGYRWMHNAWMYKGFDLNMVQAFFCGGR